MGAHSNLGVFSDAQAIAANDTWSANFIDMVQVLNQIGAGPYSPFLCIRVAVAPTDAGDTVAIQVQCSATNDATNLNGTIKNLYTICDDALAELALTDTRLATAGAWVIRMPLPYETDLRYVQLNYLQGTSNGTQTYDAWLEPLPDSTKGQGYQIIDSPVGNP